MLLLRNSQHFQTSIKKTFLASYINSTQYYGFIYEENIANPNKNLTGDACEVLKPELLNPSSLQNARNTLRLFFWLPELATCAAINNLKHINISELNLIS